MMPSPAAGWCHGQLLLLWSREWLWHSRWASRFAQAMVKSSDWIVLGVHWLAWVVPAALVASYLGQ